MRITNIQKLETVIGGVYDTYYIGSDDVVLEGTDEADDIFSNGDRLTINGGAGDDSILPHGYNNIINGGEGNDSIDNWLSYYSTISGGKGDDTIDTSTNLNMGRNVFLYNTGDGNDVLTGFHPNDTLRITGSTYTRSESDGDIILFVGDGSIRIQEQAGKSINIEGEPQITVIQSDNSNGVAIYSYDGGYKIIENYQQGEIVRLNSDYQGIGLSGNSFFVNSSSGSLEIQNARDKFIGYSASNSDVVAYSYLASGEGNIDGRDKNVAEIIIGGDNATNQIWAGNGGSSLWGGVAGEDTLVGGDGYDEFFYFIGSGNDVIQNAGDNDVINLAGINLEQISGVDVTEYSVAVHFVDGGNLRVEGNSRVGYNISDAFGTTTYTVNQSTKQWSLK